MAYRCLIVFPNVFTGIYGRRCSALFRADLSVRSSVRMPLAAAVPCWLLPAAARISAAQRLCGPLRNPPSTYGKEKVYGSIP